MKSVNAIQRILLAVSFCGLALVLGSNAAGITHAGDTSPPQPRAVIDACGEIAVDTTWSAGNVYTANNCNVVVNHGVTLTVQGGATLKVGGNCSPGTKNCALVVKGTLRTQGTATNPATFTSASDDGSGATAPGEWYGLHFMPNSQGDLNHAHVYYAGSGQSGRWDNTSFTNRAQIYVDRAAFSLQHGEVAYSPRAGIALYGASTQSFIANTRVISHTGVANNSYPGAIHQDTALMDAVYRNLTLEDNVRDVVAVVLGAFTQDVVLDGAPLMFYTSGIVPDGRSLTLMPGTLLRFPGATSGLRIQSGGHLTATGTLTQPVVFAPQEEGLPGSAGLWGGVQVEPGASATFRHATMRYGGWNTNAALWVRSSDVVLQNTEIHNGYSDGLRISNAGTQVTLENVTVRDSVRHGVYLEATTDQTLTLTNVILRDNTSDGLHVDTVNSTLLLESTTITNNGGAAIRLHPENDSPALVNSVISGNGINGVRIEGFPSSITSDRHWKLLPANLPYVLQNFSPVIRENGSLTIDPGVTIRSGLVGSGYMPNIIVRENGRLTAVGTPEQPIRFLGLDNTPGRWGGFELQNTSALTLTHCEVAYGGRQQDFGGMIPLLDINTTGRVQVDACIFRDSWSQQGITARVAGDHVIRNSRIGASVSTAVTLDPPLDVRYNWWGHPSGPRHTTLNPAGQGVAASGSMLISPWLTESPIPPAGVEVRILGPRSMASGLATAYVLNYANHTAETIQNAVLMARLPALTTYRSSTEGGLYWPERHQVFWKLGDLAPGATGQLLVNVQYQWGIPDRVVDNIAALLVGTNFNADLLDLTDYLIYTPPAATQAQPLFQDDWAGHLAEREELSTLHSEAMAQGYRWAAADRITLNSGKVVMQAIYVHPQQRWVRALHTVGNDTRATTYMPGRYTVHDTTGGMIWEIASNQQRFWGSWDQVAGAAWPGTRVEAEICAAGGAGCCLSNCLGKVAVTAVAGKLSAAVNTAMTARACANVYQTGGAPEALAECAASLQDKALTIKGVPVLGELAGITECLAQCTGDPNSNHCTGDRITCEPAWYNIYNWVGVPNRTVWRCQNGCYSAKPEFLPCAFGECCMPGVGCTSGSGSDCQGAESYVARDPNEKYGPEGDLLPGELVNYRIEYENVGEAPAFGVFISDKLHDALDDATLRLGPNAQYFPTVRLIVWDIGELDPAGQPGATGEVTLTVRLRDDLPGGAIVSNQAVVYFPSVPEETPTSTLIHRIQPVVAEAQSLTTAYATPVNVTLTGREVSSAALSYRVVEEPLFGILSGTAPNLIYTPMEHFVGMDSFAFAVDNGSMESDPAQVRITVTSAGDTTPPTVLWSAPVAGGFTPISSGAAFTDTVGPLYAPALAVGFSEALEPSTVTTATVSLTGSGGAVTIHPLFDGGSNQIVLWPRTALAEGEYTVTVGTGVTDLAGNGLASPYTLRFSVGEPSAETRIYLPAVQK